MRYFDSFICSGLVRRRQVIDAIPHRRRLGEKKDLPVFDLGWRLLAVGTIHPDRLGHAAGKRDAGFHHVFPSDIERVVHHQGSSLPLGVHSGSDRLRGIGEHAGKLVGRDVVVIPGILIGARSRRAGGEVVKMSGEFQGPGIVQAFLGIGPPAHPRSRHRGFFCGIGEDFVPEDHALVIGLGSQRSGRVVDQFQVAFVLRHARGHIRLDVVEHLVGGGLDDMDRAIAYAHGWSLRFRARLILLPEGARRRRQYGLAFGDDGFQ